MKLGKTARMFLAGGIFVVLAAILGMAYLQQGQEQSRLSQKLSTVQTVLDKQLAKFPPEAFASQQSELQSQLTRAKLELYTAETRLRQSIESIKISDACFEVADATGVEVILIDSPGVTSEQLEEVSFSVLTFTVTVEGNLANQTDFILELSDRFTADVVDLLDVDVEERLATVTIRFHSYEGD